MPDVRPGKVFSKVVTFERRPVTEDDIDKDLLCNAALDFINTVDTSSGKRTLTGCYVKLEEGISSRESHVRELAIITKDDFNFSLAFVFGNFSVDRK